ncbi:MAG TPA: glycosyltransferase [Acidimicrobiales bacterium]|nr:MAG: hypothetical protein B7X07_00790 [Actinobacteria bacterium 21-64-8]HQT99046.1 glycosyltransferase [Acidimicrobiales bacterium]
MSRTIVITGGGTGGHVFPMQAVGEALMSRGWSASDLRYVGSRRGQDRALLGDGPIALTTLPGRGLRRSWRPRDIALNVVSAALLVGAWGRAIYDLRRWRGAVVVSVGGYAAFAVDAAAVLWRRPLVLVNFDAVPGAVHRLFARFAVARCEAFGEDGPGVSVTGTPLRAAIEQVVRDDGARREARARATPPVEEGRNVVVVMTGSLGAGRVNRAVSALASRWAHRRDVTIFHVSGRRDYDAVLGGVPVLDGLDYRVLEFGDMAELWSLADVAICRAGAITVAELAALGVPSVLVPLPGAPDDHQTKNAQRLVAAGGAVLVPDAECTAERLSEVLEALFDHDVLAAMSEGARSLGREHAADAIARVVATVAS